MNRVTVVLALALSFIAPSVAGQEKMTEHTFRSAGGAAPPPATIADMAWFAGHWSGPALGGTAEEVWIAPVAGSMSGMLRILKDGKPWFYELQTIVEDDNGSLVLKVKHFNDDLTGWEERDRSEDFPLVAKGDNVLHFHGISFYREGPDALSLWVAIKKKDGSYREEVFSYKRLPR